nr:TonB-dependent receptor [uncultured Draconibacterium sp.]
MKRDNTTNYLRTLNPIWRVLSNTLKNQPFNEVKTIKHSENRFRNHETTFKSYFLIIAACLLTFSLASGNEAEIKKGTITGAVVESSTNAPLQYAQVALYNSADSSLVNGAISDSTGVFSLEKIPNGNYFLKAEFIGYQQKVYEDIVINGNENKIELPPINLTETTTEIDEVSVVAQKRNTSVQVDKKIVNVDNNLSATGGTAIDALKVSPSITVNQEGEVLLRGSTSFKVLIDGKPSALKPNEALKNMPAGRIENIEIITNPSVKYDAEGTAGIINIITKKGLGVGTSGQINASAGTGNKYNSDINLNYTNDKLNVTFGANWKDNKQFFNMDEIIETVVDGSKRRNDVLFYREQADKDYGANITLDYQLNSKNNIAYSADMGSTNFYVDANFKYDETFENEPKHSYVYEDLSMAILADYFTNNITYTRSWSDNKSWVNSVFYSKINYFFDNHQSRYNTDSDFDFSDVAPYYQMRYENDNFSTEFRAKTDYSAVDKNGGKFEAGAQYHKYNRYLDLNAETFDIDANSWVPDNIFTNELDFNEQVYSVYANYSSRFKGFNYSLGIRQEYTNRLIESFTLNEKYKYEKLNYFSSFSLSKDLKKGIQLALNYSSRIDRPDEYFLNPFPDISNEFQEAYGNPMLRPHITESYELSFRKMFEKGMFSSQAYHRKTDDAYTQVISSDDDGIMILTFDNISDDKEYGVENMVNWQATKWWSVNASLNIMGQSSKGTMNEEPFDRSAFTFDTRLINSFTFSNTSAQIMAFYFHDRIGNAIGNVEAFYWVDASVQHNFFNRRLAVTLQAKDVFNTNQLKFDINGSDYRFYVHRKPEYPVILLSVSYKFNNFKNNVEKVKTKLKIGS